MKKLLLCFLFTALAATGFSQKLYFIYLQADPEQSFYVKMNGRVHNATATGYLILPRLVDSTYNLVLGFPGNQWPEQTFTVTMNKKDHGFLLKNFNEKGWGLFHLQTLTVQMSAAAVPATTAPGATEPKNVSAFTSILSKAADDPSLLEKTIPPVSAATGKETTTAPQEVKPAAVQKTESVSQQPETETNRPVPESLTVKEEPKPEQKPDTPVKADSLAGVITTKKATEPAATTDARPDTTQTNQPVEADAAGEDEIKATVAPEEYKPTVVSKRSESSTTEGFGLVFTDDDGHGRSDTIRILIPNPKPAVPLVKEQPKEEKKFLEIPAVAAAVQPQAAEATGATHSGDTTAQKGLSTACRSVATESDFFRLRKQMAAAEGDDEMLDEARKNFKERCYLTGQIRNLCTLFLTDEGKYRFFDAAYKYTGDPERFKELVTELKEEYYVNRFNAMIRN